MRFLRWLRRWLTHTAPLTMSPDWRRDHQRRERDDYHGVCWGWPINKQRNEQAHWNRVRLRKRA